MIRIITESTEQTEKLGKLIGSLLNSGDVICLDGDLGAGKTTLTKSIVKGLGVDEYVTSPTFTIVNEYEGKVHVNHFDVYRISDVDEMYDIGYDEYMDSESVNIIEWSSIIKEILPEDRVEINIERLEEDNKRKFNINLIGERYKELIEELKKHENTSNRKFL
ncbi:tRNA (adenosine(37)-N6)-threonylcarbamoyltransferase complex ATPase subunit type 1 TsaE [Senegalia massiliensis]|uniref:tRNA (adenosine(37)-N6)-threonylcarbamoyltransferase complex ATPase subunit type 1 TsaE n=1 Tax=Senegalia massiliensis TaxID=1720316 RepID=UPI001031E8F3|nr:tRNA (adenosine(37)-N6)-threonylcarbamoyltransferase complex ATPase subunit type 1 TsaE [Senegalia massiliensis]